MENNLTSEQALERLEEQAQDLYSEHCVELDKSYREKNEQAVKVIRQALIERQFALISLNEIGKLLGLNDIDDIVDEIKEYKQVLEVLYNKRVDIDLVNSSSSVDFYNHKAFRWQKLTETEFDLIKEWLNNGKR